MLTYFLFVPHKIRVSAVLRVARRVRAPQPQRHPHVYYSYDDHRTEILDEQQRYPIDQHGALWKLDVMAERFFRLTAVCNGQTD